MMSHGVKIDLVPEKYGGTQSFLVDEKLIRMEFDDESMFLQIEKPTQRELDSLDFFELTSPYPEQRNQVHQINKKNLPEDIPIIEWRRQLAMAPEDIIRKTIQATTQFNLSLEV